MRIPVLLVLVGSVVGALGCGDDGEALGGPGPYVAGVTTLEVEGRPVEVWYPVDPGGQGDRPRDVYFIRDFLPPLVDAILDGDVNPPFETDAYRDAPPSDDGPFPLVLFAHGFASYRTESTFLTTHLASEGFVVASADYLERGLTGVLGAPPAEPVDDVTLTQAVVDLMASETSRSGGFLEGVIENGRVAITGHSAGGGTARRFAAAAEVVAYLPQSAGAGDAGLPGSPSMWLTGDIDEVVTVDRVEDAFGAAAAPTRLVVVEGMGHNGPSDLCRIGESGGGVVAIALEQGLDLPEGLVRLGTDGCQPEAVDVERGWAVFRHFITAQLVEAFGLPERPDALDPAVAARFPGVTVRYEERPGR